ncbi:MAG TPA: tetratricopeptide repeat protein [Bacteroidia bacterium]|jgi:tetratricopeptide (TPR) repeat protein|nr:tetratricopeptide repeat protein [Bacteroidia bacterium]
MRKYFLLLFLILHYGIYFSQQNVIDSLQHVLKTVQEDTNKVNSLNLLSRLQMNSDLFKEGFVNAQYSKNLSNKLHYQRGLGNALTNLGNYYMQKGDYAKSLAEYLEALKSAEERNDKKGIAGSYNNIGNIYRYNSDYPNAVEFFLKALNLFEELKNKKGISAVYANLGTVYTYLKEHQKALNYFEKSLAISEKLQNKFEIAVSLMNIGNVYLDLGDYPKALDYQIKSLKIKEEINDKKGIQATISNIGLIYSEFGEKEKALEYHYRALKLAEEIGDKESMAISECNVGINLVRFNKFDEALTHALKSLELAKETGTLLDRAEAEKLLSTIYEKKKDGLKAMEHFKLFQLLNDTIANDENTKKIVTAEMNFEFTKKEAISRLEKERLANQNQIQLLQISRRNYIVLGLGVLLLVIISIAWLVLRQNKLKSEQTAIQLEQKLLRSQMNPHFIFNALATIESFIYENQPKEAGRYLSDFARLMRLILDNSTTEYITLEKEIKTLEYYLSLQKLRLENNLLYIINVDDKLDINDVLIPPMLTQPFIENAIEHGFRGSKQTGEITISFKELNNQLVVEVKDNGIGINKAKENEKQKHHKSMALQITKERLYVLNKSKTQKLSFSVSDISDESRQSTGTKVIFSIPL